MIAVLSAVLLDRQHHRHASSFRGELFGHFMLLVSIFCPYPPTYAFFSLPKPHHVNLNRLTDVASCNGLSMVQRQWFWCALQWIHLTHFKGIFFTMEYAYDPWLPIKLWSVRVQWTYYSLTDRRACECGTDGGRTRREEQEERGRSHVEKKIEKRGRYRIFYRLIN